MSFYSSYARLLLKSKIMNPRPDVIVLIKLVDPGVNINKRPYVWERVYIISNNLLVNVGSDSIAINPSITEKGKEKTIKNFMNDCNSVLEAFLEAGADPDMLGHPYPFSYEGMIEGMTDEKANEYFKQGTRAINEAIKKVLFGRVKLTYYSSIQR